MNINKLSILLMLQKTKLNKKGKCPIRCRITYRKEKREFSTGHFIEHIYWESKLQQAKPPSNEYEFINTQMSLIKTKINQQLNYSPLTNLLLT